MDLSRILHGVSVTKLFQAMYGKMVVTHEVKVDGIQYDSRKVVPGDVFVAMRGSVVDGHRFVGEAIGRGAKVVVLEDETALPDSLAMHAGVVKVVVGDARKTLAMMSANFFDHPSTKMKLVGVTGTNGKTTTTHLIRSVLDSGGFRTGLLGTIEYRVGDKVVPATHTTPESLEVNRMLAEMAAAGCTAAVMEVSSHALVQHRVHGLAFGVAAFTNLTQDHLDFHRSMDDYSRAKKMLFDSLPSGAWAVTTTEDPYGEEMVRDTRATILRYGLRGDADVHATDLTLDVHGTTLTVVARGERQHVRSSLIGRFNARNILAACAVGTAVGIPSPAIAGGIARMEGVRGRFERVASPDGWIAIIDYAHTPDALENCLRAIHDILPAHRSIITVFGCGGDRDRSKRPVMGKIAATLSSLTVVTSDNPRTEDPLEIIHEIVAGIGQGKNYVVEPDRRSAIRKALGYARSGDVVLIAGKGHENYQVVGETRTHFDDREEVEAFIRNAR